jgi:hypothetical protein
MADQEKCFVSRFVVVFSLTSPTFVRILSHLFVLFHGAIVDNYKG